MTLTYTPVDTSDTLGGVSSAEKKEKKPRGSYFLHGLCYLVANFIPYMLVKGSKNIHDFKVGDYLYLNEYDLAEGEIRPLIIATYGLIAGAALLFLSFVAARMTAYDACWKSLRGLNIENVFLWGSIWAAQGSVSVAVASMTGTNDVAQLIFLFVLPAIAVPAMHLIQDYENARVPLFHKTAGKYTSVWQMWTMLVLLAARTIGGMLPLINRGRPANSDYWSLEWSDANYTKYGFNGNVATAAAALLSLNIAIDLFFNLSPFIIARYTGKPSTLSAAEYFSMKNKDIGVDREVSDNRFKGDLETADTYYKQTNHILQYTAFILAILFFLASAASFVLYMVPSFGDSYSARISMQLYTHYGFNETVTGNKTHYTYEVTKNGVWTYPLALGVSALFHFAAWGSVWLSLWRKGAKFATMLGADNIIPDAFLAATVVGLSIDAAVISLIVGISNIPTTLVTTAVLACGLIVESVPPLVSAESSIPTFLGQTTRYSVAGFIGYAALVAESNKGKVFEHSQSIEIASRLAVTLATVFVLQTIVWTFATVRIKGNNNKWVVWCRTNFFVLSAILTITIHGLIHGLGVGYVFNSWT